MIDKYLLDELSQRSDEKGELARWVLEFQVEVDRERRKSAALEREIYRLQGIVNTPVKLPPLIPDDGYSVDAMCNWARNEARNKIALIIVSHGLTVQED